MASHILFSILPYACYFYYMKTTAELSDAIVAELKEKVKERNSSMRELMESAVRHYLAYLDEQKKPYHFENHSFKGNGVREGIEEGQWENIRAMIYEGRGG